MQSLRSARGFTIVELLVSMLSSAVVMTGVVMLTTTVIHNQDRISRRVDANSRARPAMTRIVQGLHSACVASHIVPIQAGSTGTSISFLSKSGSGVGLTPDLHNVYLTTVAGKPTLKERVFPPDPGGTAPTWTFSSTASSDRELLRGVAAPGNVIFRYYDFINGALSTTPLTTPLSASDAARVSYVTISFASNPSNDVSRLDPGSPVIINSGVDLRLENAGQYPNQDNLPCV